MSKLSLEPPSQSEREELFLKALEGLDVDGCTQALALALGAALDTAPDDSFLSKETRAALFDVAGKIKQVTGPETQGVTLNTPLWAEESITAAGANDLMARYALELSKQGESARQAIRILGLNRSRLRNALPEDVDTLGQVLSMALDAEGRFDVNILHKNVASAAMRLRPSLKTCKALQEVLLHFQVIDSQGDIPFELPHAYIPFDEAYFNSLSEDQRLDVMPFEESDFLAFGGPGQHLLAHIAHDGYQHHTRREQQRVLFARVRNATRAGRYRRLWERLVARTRHVWPSEAVQAKLREWQAESAK